MIKRIAGFLSLALFASSSLHAQDPIVIRAGTLIDGRGAVQRNVLVFIRNGRIERVSGALQPQQTKNPLRPENQRSLGCWATVRHLGKSGVGALRVMPL